MESYAARFAGTKEYLLVYGELIAAARYRGVVTYQAVAQIMGLPLSGNYMQKQVGQMLGEICEAECHQGRPMISAIVVGVSGLPGKGFYDLAKGLGRLTDDSEESGLRFWESEKQAVYQAWAKTFKS